MTIEEHIEYWKTLAQSDLETAGQILASGRNLHYCLFLGHLSLEKLLKACVVASTGETPPRTHNLVSLAEPANVPIDNALREKLKLFNSFNLEARYPDYKLSFYKLCTPEFTQAQFSQIKEAYSWIEAQLQRNTSGTSED